MTSKTYFLQAFKDGQRVAELQKFSSFQAAAAALRKTKCPLAFVQGPRGAFWLSDVTKKVAA